MLLYKIVTVLDSRKGNEYLQKDVSSKSFILGFRDLNLFMILMFILKLIIFLVTHLTLKKKVQFLTSKEGCNFCIKGFRYITGTFMDSRSKSMFRLPSFYF